MAPSLDSISEVKVQASNSRPSTGRAGGANIIVVTKSGTSRFSGSAAYYKRHEAFNANTWDRQRACDTSGGSSALCDRRATGTTIGVHPRWAGNRPGNVVQRERDKLFFFYSLDLLPRSDPFLVNTTFPSALERNGEFSQTVNNAGQLRYIRDPQRAAV